MKPVNTYHHKIATTLLLASLLSIVLSARLSAQDATAKTPLWKVINTELRNDDRKFVVILERSFMSNNQRESFTIKKIAFAVRSDNNLLTYAPVTYGFDNVPVNGLPSEKITIDLDNKSELLSVSELISDFRKWDNIQKADYLHDIPFTDNMNSQRNPSVKTFSGMMGDFNVDYEVSQTESHESRAYGGSIFLTSKDGDVTKNREICEPTALEQVIQSVDSFRKMQQEAIQAKVKQLAAQKALQAEQAQDEIATAKADSDEKAKIEDAARQQQLAEQEKQQKLQAIKDAEIEARHNKALAFISTSEGQSMTQQISSLEKDIKALDEKERRADYGDLLDKRDALAKEIQDYHLTDDERHDASRDFAITALDITKADAAHESSDKLKRMTSNYNLLLTQFEEKSGMPYQDVMALKR